MSLSTFLGFGEEYVERYAEKRNHHVFLHIKRVKTEIPSEPITEGPEKKITRLAIGVEGGYDPEAGKRKFKYTETYNIVVIPTFTRLPYPSTDYELPIKVLFFSFCSRNISFN